jgi:DNA-binding FadR family transcriptional regulator
MAGRRGTPARGPRVDKVSDTIARRILEDVVARDLGPGAMLPSEASMAEQFGVGRPSLREALRVLEVLGLIRVRPGPGGGPAVADVDASDFGRTATFYLHAKRARFLDLLSARVHLEPLMARLAAERGDPAANAELAANIEASRATLAEPGLRWSSLMNDFHGLVSGMSGNPVLDLVVTAMNDIHSDRVRPMYPLGSRDGVFEEHRAIAEAIVSGEADLAERLTREHWEHLSERFHAREPGLMGDLIDWH